MNEENNKLIADFMGYPCWRPANKVGNYDSYRTTKEDCENLINGSQFLYHMGYKAKLREMKYHASWDWLMPVVEKIGVMGYKFKITIGYTAIFDRLFPNPELLSCYSNGLLVNTYNAVIQFIQWYNAQPNQS